jgi:hypothetical protein
MKQLLKGCACIELKQCTHLLSRATYDSSSLSYTLVYSICFVVTAVLLIIYDRCSLVDKKTMNSAEFSNLVSSISLQSAIA